MQTPLVLKERTDPRVRHWDCTWRCTPCLFPPHLIQRAFKIQNITNSQAVKKLESSQLWGCDVGPSSHLLHLLGCSRNLVKGCIWVSSCWSLVFIGVHGPLTFTKFQKYASTVAPKDHGTLEPKSGPPNFHLLSGLAWGFEASRDHRKTPCHPKISSVYWPKRAVSHSDTTLCGSKWWMMSYFQRFGPNLSRIGRLPVGLRWEHSPFGHCSFELGRDADSRLACERWKLEPRVLLQGKHSASELCTHPYPLRP